MDFIEVIKFGTNKQCIKIFNAIYDIYDVVYILSKKYLVGLCILGLILLGRNAIKK
ncbi:hypothetical protein H477_5912 [[Clostridium] sordellii ATCC 9714]|nr:hypothetical protein H477_5912 [[Clostridium] sordellii ATCC 9714] [Paeniclostridium sordellii ATCC 9714]